MKTHWLAAFALFLFLPFLHAEEEVVTPQPPSTERSIYIPFEKLQETLGSDQQGVFLPYREFLEMWNKLNLPHAVKPTEPPVDGVLAAGTYSGVVKGDVAEIKAKLSFESLKDGWSKLAIGAGALSIAEAKSEALLNYGENGYEVLFPHKGPYEVDATLYGGITRAPGRSTLKLALPRTSVSQFELTIPGHGLDFTVTPGGAFSAVENADGTTRLVAYFGAAAAVEIDWAQKASETALAPLLFANVRTDLRIGGGAIRTTANVDYKISRAGVRSLEILLPEGHQILSVTGENLKEWTIAAAEGAQKLHVDLHAETIGQYSLIIGLEAPLPVLPTEVKMPVLTALNAERQRGSVSIFGEADLVLEIGHLAGLVQQSAPPSKEGAPVLAGAYGYLRLPYAGTVSVSQAQPRIAVSSSTLVTVTSDLVSLDAKFQYTVKKAGIFSVQIELPPGFQFDPASGESIESSSVQAVDGKNVETIKFNTPRMGVFTLGLTASATRPKPDAPLLVPVFAPRGVDLHEASVGLAINTSLKANTSEQARGDLHEEDIRNLPEMVKVSTPQAPLTLGFRYRGAAKPAEIQFELRKPRLSAEVLGLTEVHETNIRTTWTVAYQIEYAGVKEFSVEVPKAIADEVEITGADIKEKMRADDATKPDGLAIWRVVLQHNVLGPYQLKLTHESTRAEQKQGASVKAILPEIKPLGLFRETGQIAVTKDGNLEFTATDAKGLELIDPKELHDPLKRDGVILAYKYASHPAQLTLDIAKNLYMEVPSAIASFAVLSSVVADDQAETTEVVYWVKNNTQQFFSIQLPSRGKQTAKLLSDVFVNGEPQQPSRRPETNELLIRLPARQAADTLFPIRFVYEIPSPDPGSRLGWRGTLQLEPPKLVGTRILQTKWTLFLPRDQRYVKFKGAMREDVGGAIWEVFVSDAAYDHGNAHNEPPALPAPKATGFDTQIQKDGLSVVLRRLAEPAPTSISYRSRVYSATLASALLLLAFYGGIRLLGRSRVAKLRYFLFVGVGALIMSGAVDPRSAASWKAIYAGVFASSLIWIGWRFLTGLSGIPERVRRYRASRLAAAVPPPIKPPTAAAPPSA